MASEDKKIKTVLAPKSETAVKEAVATKENDKAQSKDQSTLGVELPKAESGERATDAPSSYSRGEGQKPVSKAYKDNWNAVYGKKKKKKR
jgi:hypothetical protein